MNMDMDTDKILYDKFLHGDHSALEALIDRHKESLTLFLYSYLKNMVEAENMMIDVFAQLVLSAAKFRNESSLKTYLFTIGRHEAIRYLKKNKQHLTLDEINENLLSTETFVELDILKHDENRQLYLAISRLHPDYKEIIYLIYFEEMTYKEAAQVMKKSEKQITNLVYRSKKSLKHLLEQEGFHYDGE